MLIHDGWTLGLPVLVALGGLVVGFVLGHAFRWGTKGIVSMLALVALLAVSAFAALVVKENADRTAHYGPGIQRLRDEYPFVSIEDRLPPAPPRVDIDAANWPFLKPELKAFENGIANESYDREARLQKLHQGSVEEFVRREGFGATRMFGGYAESLFANFGRGKKSVAQPRSAHLDLLMDPAQDADPPGIDPVGLLQFHRRNAVHFANPLGFGFVKDRKNVAGFQAHQFNELPDNKAWQVERIELIGLLMESQPRVYVTEELPRMGKIREIPTRDVDVFETTGLANLRAGSDLFYREAQHGIRMLGAVRSVEQCVKCHGGERGALLGAFSYSLTRLP